MSLKILNIEIYIEVTVRQWERVKGGLDTVEH